MYNSSHIGWLGREHAMKKTYDAPMAEVVKFEYKDQVVVASGIIPDKCTTHRSHEIVAGSGAVCSDQGEQNA